MARRNRCRSSRGRSPVRLSTRPPRSRSSHEEQAHRPASNRSQVAVKVGGNEPEALLHEAPPVALFDRERLPHRRAQHFLSRTSVEPAVGPSQRTAANHCSSSQCRRCRTQIINAHAPVGQPTPLRSPAADRSPRRRPHEAPRDKQMPRPWRDNERSDSVPRPGGYR